MTDNTPGTDVVFATASLKDRMDWSRAIAGAGNLVPAGFRDGPNANPAKILLAVEYGAMLGLHPMAALAGIHVIDGKPTLSAALMSALVHKAGHRLRITTTGAVTGTGNNLGGDFTATVTLIRADDPQHPFVSTWTIDRAKRAGLWGKGNWLKYPENQMTWRGVSEATKLGAPEVLSGVWYTPDELGATVDEDGEVIQEAEVVEQDHDGPNVTATMRETGTPKVRSDRGVTNEKQVMTASDREPTPAPTKRPGASRTASKPATGGTEPTRDHNDVFREWGDRIDETLDVDSLIKLHTEAAERNILDIRHSGGLTIEGAFLARRQELLDAQAQESATDHGSEDDADTEPF